MQDASHHQTSTPLTPLPEKHWRDLWKQQAERHATSRPDRYVLPRNCRLHQLPPDLLRAHLRRVEQRP